MSDDRTDKAMLASERESLKREIAEKNTHLAKLKEKRKNFVTMSEYNSVKDTLVSVNATLMHKNIEIEKRDAIGTDFNEAMGRLKGFIQERLSAITPELRDKATEMAYQSQIELIANCDNWEILFSTYERFWKKFQEGSQFNGEHISEDQIAIAEHRGIDF